MSPSIPSTRIEALKERLPYESLYRELAGDLRGRGAEREALCPFHDDSNPSMRVNVEEGLFHCHGCGVGGDFINFYMRRKGLEFPEAVEELAGRVGISLNGPSGCTVTELGRAKKLPAGWLREQGVRDGERRGSPAVRYSYLDEDGTEITARHRVKLRGRNHTLALRGSTLAPYGLDRLPEAYERGEIVLVEGETDTLTLWFHDLSALGVPGATTWKDEWDQYIEGLDRVYAVVEPDQGGQSFARKLSERPFADRLSFIRLDDDVSALHCEDPDAFLARWGEAKRRAVPVAEWEPEPNIEDRNSEAEHDFPPPLSASELAEIEEPEEQWIAAGLVPALGNVLVAGFPKSHKTNFLLDLAVSAASATPFLGRFDVPRRHRVGIVLMEGARYQLACRLQRIALAKGIMLGELEDGLVTWFRPPLVLSDERTVQGLGGWVEHYGLDLLLVDGWSYVQGGDSNNSDEVTPQLMALSGLREVAPGLTVALLHHLRKRGENRPENERVTEMIRNSTAFGAWYDAGVLLSRPNETAPVNVRVELRDYPSPEAFAFSVEDEYPGDEANGVQPWGWLRLRVEDDRPEVVQRRAAAERFIPEVVDHLRRNPGCSKSSLKDNITGENPLITTAFEILCEQRRASYSPPERNGLPGRCFLREEDPAGPRRDPAGGGVGTHPADPAAPPEGGRQRRGSPAEREVGPGGGGSGRGSGDDGTLSSPTEPEPARAEPGTSKGAL